MRTTLDLDDDIAEAARALAHAERRPLGQVVSDLARRGLAPRLTKADQEDGFPVFRVSEDAPPITPDMVRGALEET